MSTVVYAWPIAGATAPTAAQALLANLFTGTAAFSDADTVAVITHNLKLTAAQLAFLFPLVTFVFSVAGTLGVNYAVALTDSSTVTITKASTATGSGSTLSWQIARPWSGVQ